MIRLIVLIGKVAFVTGLVLWLATDPGNLTLEWRGYQVKTSAAFLLIATFLLIALCLGVARALRWVQYGPKAWARTQHIQRLERGHQRLSECLAALAAGDAHEAGRKAIAARKLLDRAPATLFLQAQAASLANDDAAAIPLFRELTQKADTAMLGWRGLIVAALKGERYEDAAALISDAQKQQPNAPWLSVMRLTLAARQGNWQEADTALQAASQTRLLNNREGRLQEAALHLAKSQELSKQGHYNDALAEAEHAARLQPEWLPALIELAQAQLRAGHDKAAARTVQRGWRITPHPELALLWKNIHRDRDDIDRLKSFEQLAKVNPDHMQSKVALAEAAVAARLWGEARRHLESAVAESPDRKAFRLLALVAQHEHDHQGGDQLAAARWLAKAAEAPPEAQWICRSCGGSAPHWQPGCPHCRDFVTLEWQRPGQSRAKPGTAKLTAARDTGTV